MSRHQPISTLFPYTTLFRSTVGEVRHAFSKCDGNLGTSGSVAFMFHRQGRLTLPEGVSEDAVIEATLEAGPDDIETFDDGTLEVVTSPEAYHEVQGALIAAGIEPARSQLGLLDRKSVV